MPMSKRWQEMTAVERLERDEKRKTRSVALVEWIASLSEVYFEDNAMGREVQRRANLVMCNIDDPEGKV